MTCEEYARITNRNPEESTRAEIMAVKNHFDQCEPCREKIERGAARFDKVAREALGPAGFALYEKLSDARAKKLGDAVRSDPEFIA